MRYLVGLERNTRSIREIILRRPECRNALSVELLSQLLAALESLSRDSDVRVVILRAEGSVFCSGLDLREAADESLIDRSAAILAKTLGQLRDSPLVTIAAVQGGAYAGGAGLMAACDLVVAAENVKIGFPEARRGLLPALISQVLRPKVRDGDLRTLFLVGEPIDGLQARQMGLVQFLVPEGNVLSEALRIAAAVVAGGPDAIRGTKRLLNSFGRPAEDVSLEELHLAARRSAEAQEGLAAYLEKRSPAWTLEDAS